MKENTDNMEFEDSENFKGSNESLGIKQIVLKQFQKCCEEGAKEMDIGGVKKRVIGGQVFEIPTPNQRQVFMNTIKMLHITLKPQFKQKEKIVKPIMDEFYKEMDALKSRYDKAIANLPPLQYHSPDYKANPQKIVKERNMKVNAINNELELKMVGLHKDFLLVAISNLLNNLNYFEEGGFSAG